jgi:CheY-like chemotaxis protein
MFITFACANLLSMSDLQNKVILLVDDSENDALLLSREFARAGLRNPIIWVSSGKKAIAYLKGEDEYANRDRSPFPSILLLDLNMPEVNGFDVLEWIGREPGLRNLLVIVLSGMDDTRSVQRAYALGANSYLTKPVNPYDLANMVNFFRGYWMVPDPPRPPGDDMRINMQTEGFEKGNEERSSDPLLPN